MKLITKLTYGSLLLSSLRMKKKAINFLEKNVSELEDPREKSSIIFYIGTLYLEIGDSVSASKNYLEALSIVENLRLEYHPDFLKILRTIYENEDEITFKKWFKNFENRIYEDAKFKKIYRKFPDYKNSVSRN